jgi:hypothetical protein
MKTIDEVLLAHGGDRVLHQDDEYDALLVAHGRLLKPRRVTLKRGQEHHCHRNTSGLYLLRYPDCRIVTGYALLGGAWIRHSWLLDGDKVIETTHKFPLYFGATLDDRQAAKFVICDVMDLSPAVRAFCLGEAGCGSDRPTAETEG